MSDVQHLAAPHTADHLFLTGAPDPGLLATVSQGSDMYPEGGATLVIPAQLGAGAKLRLTGPGVDGAAVVLVSGVAPAFWAARARVMRYPMGFEIFLLDGDQVMGLPRSIQIEAL